MNHAHPPPSDDTVDSGANNPYYSQHQRASMPDLDAATPVLRAEEAQRLNRKALFFLGATLLVVIAISAMVLSRSGKSDARSQRAPRQERVSIPELPRASHAVAPTMPPPLPATQAIPLVASAPPAMPASPYLSPDDTGRQRAERPLSLRERRILDAAEASSSLADHGSGRDGLASDSAGRVVVEGSPENAAIPRAVASRPGRLDQPDVRMVRGTYVRCVMETRIMTDLQGFSSCVVTEPVYSVNGRRMLLPRGTKVYGTYGARDFVNNRVAVVWDRILTPDGIDISISAPGVDALGSSGTPGDYDAHWASRISGALMVSLISDAFKYAAAENGPTTARIDNAGYVVQEPFESNTAGAMERLARTAIEDNLRRPPTVTVNQGSVINIYVTQDVDFSDVLPQG